MKTKVSFTLMEIVIAFIILAILVSLAFAFFMKAIERARVKEAISNLKLIQAAEHIKHLEFYQFYPCSTTGSPDCTSELDLAESLPTNNWNYTVTCTDPTVDFTATASRVDGPWSDCQYTLTDTVGNRSEPQAVDASKCVLP